MGIFGHRIEGAADWWDPTGAGLCIWAAYQPKGAASLVASYIDLSGNGNNAGVGVAPTWDAVNGWKFNGSTQYLTTGFVPSSDTTQSMIVQYTTRTSAAYRAIAGISDSSSQRLALSGQWTAGVAYMNGGGLDIAPLLNAGNLCVAGVQGYRNGVADGAAFAPAWGGIPTSSVYIGCWNASGVAALFCALYIQAFALYDCTLTAPQVLAVANAMVAL